ncbi:Cytochrome P450 [Sphingobium faniae]|nr:Cytochrome P450 [Sphingobium faniae]
MTRPTVAFDQHGEEFARDWRGVLARMRAETPLAWTEAHGGFWVATKYDDIVEIERTPAIFSCDHDMTGGPGTPQGVRIPPSPIKFHLNESDPPKHGALRKIEQPHFPIDRLRHWIDEAEILAHECMDRMTGQGGGDLVEDYTIPVAAQTVLRMVGIPPEEWRDYMAAALAGFLPTDHPDYPLEARLRIGRRVEQLMGERRGAPRGDILSAIANARIDGAPIDPDIARSMVMPLVFGGFDTTAATAASALHWLCDKPHLWDRLVEDRKFLDQAVHEWLRYFTPVTGGLARTVMQETELRGQKLMPGERILLMFASGSYDEERFENPDRVDLDRLNARQHLAFGAGPHRCIGATLGHAEICTMVRVFLSRVSDYSIDNRKARRFPTMGLINGWLIMPAMLTGK